jgi:pSer/pThr/pTyr-binding forkhead associated (FHA) protein
VDVTDLSSTNGTFVNGKRIERASLANGDRLRVGRVELTLERAGGRKSV